MLHARVEHLSALRVIAYTPCNDDRFIRRAVPGLVGISGARSRLRRRVRLALLPNAVQGAKELPAAHARYTGGERRPDAPRASGWVTSGPKSRLVSRALPLAAGIASACSPRSCCHAVVRSHVDEVTVRASSSDSQDELWFYMIGAQLCQRWCRRRRMPVKHGACDRRGLISAQHDRSPTTPARAMRWRSRRRGNRAGIIGASRPSEQALSGKVWVKGSVLRG